MYFGYTDCFVIICSFLGFFILYAWNRNQFFKRNGGINAMDAKIIFGNMLQVFLGRKHLIDIMQEAYYKYPDDKFVGIFNFMTPMFVIKDLDLIKQITVKDFDHFVDHMKFTDEKVDPLLGKILFALEGEKWQEMRNTLSPAFTGSKMRGMFPFIIECAEKLIDYLKQETDQLSYKRLGYIELETKDLVSRYTNDVIASCAFGYKVDSFNDKMNIFFKMAKTATQFSAMEIFKLFIFLFSPILAKIFRFGSMEKESNNFFRNLVMDNINTREKHKIVRPDMIHLLMLAKQGSLNSDDVSANDNNKLKKTKWSDDDLAAQALVFLFAGFDSSANVISFMFHELAVNTAIQKKLQKEIDDFIKDHSGKVEYSNLNKLKYLDMVVAETLRMYPAGPVLDRVCVKSYTLPPQNENTNYRHKLKKGDLLWISAYDIQRDPKYYKDPDTFIPERFSNETNAIILNSAKYLSFGIGPRACIGSRFAIMQMKMIALYILANFNIITTPKTSNPIKIRPHLFEILPENGFWIGIKKR